METNTISHVLGFCGNSYLYVATVDKAWHDAYPFATRRTAVELAVFACSTARSALPALRDNTALNNAAFFHASKFGNFDVLNMLKTNKRPQGLYTCAVGAVAGGKPDSLSWAVANGFCVDRFVCYQSSANGNLDMLKRAVELGCPWDPERCTFIAHRQCHGHVVTWINQSTR